MQKPHELTFLDVLLGFSIVMLLALALAWVSTNDAFSQELKHRTAPPVHEKSCAERLDDVRFREWKVAKIEGDLHVAVHEHTDAVWFYREAQFKLTDHNLDVNSAHCTEKWLDTSEATMLLLEQAYRDDLGYYQHKGLIK